jgi:hypothetical protein
MWNCVITAYVCLANFKVHVSQMSYVRQFLLQLVPAGGCDNSPAFSCDYVPLWERVPSQTLQTSL